MTPCAALLQDRWHTHWCSKQDRHTGPHLCGHSKCRRAWNHHKAAVLQKYLLIHSGRATA